MCQVNFLLLDGVNGFFGDVYQVADLVANACCFTALVVNLCHGEEPLPVQYLLVGIEDSMYSCSDWPATVPLSAFEVMSITVLIKGLLLSRVMRISRRYGPMMLIVQKMLVDMILWVLLSAINVVAFGSAFYVLYVDKYDYSGARLRDGQQVCEDDFDKAFEDWFKA